VKADVLAQLNADRADKRPVALVTGLESGDQRLVYSRNNNGLDGISSDLIEAAKTALRDDRSRPIETDAGRYFIQVHNPPLRLFIVGAVHIAQPLVVMAEAAGYDVTLIDPREAFASADRFPGGHLVHDWPDAALAAHGLDSRTAVVTLTHDPKLDDPALDAALQSPVFYIGALGSKRTHAKRVARLTEAGFTEAQIARIDAPIGLDIGSRSPAEIAIAILAQLTERLRRPATRRGGEK